MIRKQPYLDWLNKNRDYYVKALNKCNIKNYDRVLDLGCGSGIWSFEIKKNNKKVYALDIDKEDIDYANSTKKEWRLSNIWFIIGSAEALPFQDNYFDAVVTISVLQYVDREITIKEIARVLKKNGKIISIFNHGFGYYAFRWMNPREDWHRSLDLFKKTIKRLFFGGKHYYYITKNEINCLCKSNKIQCEFVSFSHPFIKQDKYIIWDFMISFIGKKYM